VAALLAAGCHTDRQLAERLTITPGTAGVHVQRILDKLGLHSRWEVADWARGDDPQAASSDAGEARPAAQRV
jgi:DNA-binding NarL/FixJ family response regulator